MARSLFPMDWCEITNGSHLDLLCKVQIFDVDHDNHLMELIPSCRRFFLSGLNDAGCDSYTIFDATLETQFPFPRVSLGPKSSVLGHSEVTWEKLTSVIDMCCGFGGMSQGLLAGGFHTTVAVDHNEKMVKLFSTVHDVPTITGDVGDKNVIKEIWKVSQGARTLTGGFSCQPFSVLGDCRSSADSRSTCLTKLLYAAFYLRTQILILECVVPAAQDQFVKSELEYFCKVTGYTCSQKTLKLDCVWPCKRSRSWWILTSPPIGQVRVPDLTCQHPVLSVDRVIPYISPWDVEDEKALFLSSEECAAFGGSQGDFSSYLLNAKGVAPCALHAWGNQLTACPCGCRQFGLSHARLADKGLFGLLVNSASTDDCPSHIRHIHPCEALALNGMDPTLDYGHNPRLILSAVGQVASPIHVHWIVSALNVHLQELRMGKAGFDHETQLQAYLSWLLMRCQLVWPQEQLPIPEKLGVLVACWKSVEHLSLGELMFPPRWSEQIEGLVTIADILDVLFRTQVTPKPSAFLVDDSDVDMHDPETPWLDQPIPTNDPCGEPGIDAKFCTVVFEGETFAPIKLSPLAGNTVNDLVCAHQQLVGMSIWGSVLILKGMCSHLTTPLKQGN